jgi:hypothetical protein
MSQPIPTPGDAPSGDELQQFEQRFGPFDPPPRYQFEPEFNNPVPRPIPPELYQGPYCHRRRMAIIGMFSAGIVLLVCYLFPFVRSLGLYVLPLQYLHWLAVFLVTMSGVGWVTYLSFRGPLAYVEEGIPLVARIVDLSLRLKSTFHGVPAAFEYVATLQHLDPVTGELVLSSARHEVLAADKDRVTLSYRVGDYVTAVYLPRNPAKSLRLYGFLDLRPDLGVVPRMVPRGESNQWTVMQLIRTIGASGGFFLMMVWSVYAFGKFTPLEFSFCNLGVPLLIGMVLGGGWLRYMARRARKARSTLEESNQANAAERGAVETPLQPKGGLFGKGRRIMRSAFFAFAIMMLGGAVMVSWAFTLNALFDSSPAVFRPIRIREMWMITHDFVFREYEIEYELADDPAKETHKLLTTPSHMESFGPLRSGFAHVRRGLLGWPWVETLTPTKPKALGADK